MRAPRAAVTAPHHLAASAGLVTLARGGTAIDAAIATAAVLGVVYPHMTGPGGDAFWLVADPADRETGGRARVLGLNASGRAAGAATLEAYRARGEAIPWRGPLAALTVPGAVDGWWEAYRLSVERWGSTLPWADLLAPAIGYAAGGYPCSESQARWTAANLDEGDTARKALQHVPGFRRAFLTPAGGAPQAGQLLTNPGHARALEQIAAGGREAFYRGALAGALAQGLAEAGSPLALEDLAAHRSQWVEPIALHWRGLEVLAMPPNAQGLAALQILGILEAAGVEGTADGSAERLHLAVEATRLAFTDRDRWVADPAFAPAPLDRLLDPAYLAARARLIDRARRAAVVAPGIGGPAAADARPRGGDTVWLGAVDGAGRMASVIQSLYFDFGSGIVPGDTGILVQNRGSAFRLDDPAHPNALLPGKRPFHTLCPLLLLRDGRPVGVLGAMGGDGQPQTCAALLLRMFVDGLDPQAAIEAPRWLYGRTWGAAAETLTLEAALAPAAEALARRGHPVAVGPGRTDTMGHAGAILVGEAGVRMAGADPRGDGAAVGF